MKHSKSDTTGSPSNSTLGNSLSNYEPIACHLYDELESAAVTGKECAIQYKNSQQQIVEIEDRIADVFQENKQEFILLKSGVKIRLDQLVKINGVNF